MKDNNETQHHGDGNEHSSKSTKGTMKVYALMSTALGALQTVQISSQPSQHTPISTFSKRVYSLPLVVPSSSTCLLIQLPTALRSQRWYLIGPAFDAGRPHKTVPCLSPPTHLLQAQSSVQLAFALHIGDVMFDGNAKSCICVLSCLCWLI